MILKIVSKIFKALRSNESPGQLAWGFVLGMIIGVTPYFTLHDGIIILLIIVLKVNISMAIVAWLISLMFAYLLDPLFHSLGYWLLVEVEALRPVWVYCSEKAVLAFAHFNNTVVLGSLVISLLLVAPVYLLTVFWVQQYRLKLEPTVQKWKIVKILKGSKLYKLYDKLGHFGE